MASESSSGSWEGWVPSPNQRGTIEILWTCFATLNLCLYSMLHLNIPAAHEKISSHFWRKVRWAFLGLLAPELPMLFACGQWTSAHRSVQVMRQLGHDGWSLEHGFYADMGGFVLEPPDAPPFPVSAKILEYLVREQHVKMPAISRDEIRDKSKADGITKTVTCLQTAWLLLQVVGRAWARLPITPLELSTICVAGCCYTTLWFWRRKPLDIAVPTRIVMSRPVADIVSRAGMVAKGPVQDTPLDFIEPEAYMSRKWSRTVFGWIEGCGLQATPMDRVPNDRDPQPAGLRAHLWLGVVTAAFASIHFEAWNADFPTQAEQTFWRANCVVMWVLLAVYGTFEVVVCWMEGYQKLGLDTLGAYKRRFPACLWFFIPAGLYMCTRLGILFESLWSMRSMPAAVFETVQWTEWFPHV